MRHHERARVRLANRLAQVIEDARGVALVEVAGGLVGEEEDGLVHEGARNRGALHLSAGKCPGAPRAEAFHPHRREGRLGAHAPLARRNRKQRERERDILRDAEVRKQVERLEDKADMTAPPQRERVVVLVGKRFRIEADLAAIGPIQSRDQVEECRLARSRLAHDRDPFAARDIEIDVIEESRRGVEALRDPANLEHAVIRLEPGEDAERGSADCAKTCANEEPAFLR